MNAYVRGYRFLALHMVRQAVRDIKSSVPTLRTAGWAYLKSEHCRDVLAVFEVDIDYAMRRLKEQGYVEGSSR